MIKETRKTQWIVDNMTRACRWRLHHSDSVHTIDSVILWLFVVCYTYRAMSTHVQHGSNELRPVQLHAASILWFFLPILVSRRHLFQLPVNRKKHCPSFLWMSLMTKERWTPRMLPSLEEMTIEESPVSLEAVPPTTLWSRQEGRVAHKWITSCLL